MLDICIPALIVPTMFPQIQNVRLPRFPRPVLTWWPLKYIKLPSFVSLDSFVCVIEQIYLAREETGERFDRRASDRDGIFIRRP